MNQKIAVIILNYFGFENTLKCINSVQTKLNSFVFLVDNSTDSKEKSKLLHALQHKKNIYILFPRKNVGFAAGVNLAIKEAIKKGFEWFLLLNNDAILLNGAGSQLKRALSQFPMSLIAPIIRWGGAVHKGNFYHKYLGLIVSTGFPNSNYWLYYLTGCALAFDLGFLNKVGLMNEKFFMYGEDIEYTFRALEKGAPIKLIENEIVYHEGTQSAGMASLFYEYHNTRMHFLLSFILFKKPLGILISILCKIFVLSTRAIVRSIRYKSFSPLTALILAPLPLNIRPNYRHRSNL